MVDQLNARFHFILGSSSPRRKELLQQLGLRFEVRRGEFDENVRVESDNQTLPELIAKQKAEVLAPTVRKGELLITADTLVLSENEVLGKPPDREKAMSMLQKLSGRSHQVITGVCLLTENKIASFSEVTDVWFHKMSPDEIAYYISNFHTSDKAGAYGIQDWIGLAAVKQIRGCYFNVVGLPVPALYQKLKEFLL